MSRELDRRDFTRQPNLENRAAELRSVAATLSERLPGPHRIRVARMDPATGNPAAITSEAAPAEPGDYVQRALEHVTRISRALGFLPAQPPEYAADPNPQTTSSGAVAVHLQQLHRGIPIFQAAETVRFEPDGAIRETVGSSVTVPEEVEVSVRVPVERAVLEAARHVAVPHPDEREARDPFGEPLAPPAVDIEGFEPRIVAAFPEKPERLTLLDRGPFGDTIKASLIWFPIDSRLRLTWEVILTMPNYAGQYRTLVDAEDAQILYCKQLIVCALGRGNVFRRHGGEPRQSTDFPLPLTDYNLPVPSDLPPGFPDHWLQDAQTQGNSVLARLGDAGSPASATLQNGLAVFEPANAESDDQKVLNIFYYNCYMHDFFYLLGFRERDGNFQQDNFGRGGIASDRVDARAHPGPVFGTANMATPMDGFSPIMNMGLVSSTRRHTAFDSSVVYHEFTHGVTNRLVGGPANVRALDAPQSRGMGEGWGDYIACTINDTVTVGDWVVDDPAGIRGFPYTSDFPDHFGMLGSGRYDEEHNIGEIWCAALLEMNRRIGRELALQLVVDALKLTPANPSLLDGRDAILRALADKHAAGQLSPAEFDTAESGIWGAFAKFGMGPGARSNGPSLAGIHADFSTPSPEPDTEPEPGPEPSDTVRVEATPDVTIPDNTPSGVTHVMNVARQGRIRRLTVTIDIEHTWIGDLRVTLLSPSGRSATLHNRGGGSQHNLTATYRSEDIPGLADLLGDPVMGDWTLTVSDHAGQDTGRLRRWAMEFALEAGEDTERAEASPGQMIPDNNPAGISSAVQLTHPGVVRGIKVTVDITHTWIGDLRVELVAPSGQTALLHDRSGRDEDNLIRSYDSVTSPTLGAMIGQPIAGKWQLRVADLAAQDSGKLNHWSIEVSR